MQATRFEFEQRFWVIGAIFFAGFACSWFDNMGAAAGLIHILLPSLDLESDRATTLIRTVFFLAAALVFLAAFLRTWSTAYLRTEIVHDAAQHTDLLIKGGPYRHMRNPLYLAAILMAAGVGTMASRLGWAFIVVAMTIFFYRLIFREEAGMLATQGESFRAYLKAVPRMIPSPWPRLPAGNTRPSWGQAFIGELFFWLLAAGMVALAITLDMRLTGIIFAASMVIYFIAVGILKSKAAKQPAS